MTRTTSAKKHFGDGLAIFGFELKKCRMPLIIFAILAAFFITVILSMTLVSVNRMNTYPPSYEATGIAIASAMDVFARSSSALVFAMTCVFTIIYTLRAFSYLHNKRKADWVNPMPVNSGVMLVSKALAAFSAAVVPALFFIGIICIVSLCFGATISPDILALFVKIPLGSIACISFYGLLAVCCGSSANTVLTFLAICFCYPVSMFFIKGMLDSFFCGLPTDIRGEHFLLKALNPLAAYDGVNVIYWILFTLGCFAASVLLLRRRKAERAQTSFAFRLPCYAVEMMITFIVGMLLGILFASFNMFGAPFGGFVFGFLLGGAAAFVIAHVILFLGFSKFLKSLICFGAVSAAAILFTAVCCFMSEGYANFLPERDSIASAGYIYFDSDGYYAPKTGDTTGLINSSAEDFSSEKEIDSIYNSHEKIMRRLKKRGPATKFRSIFSTSFTFGLRSLTGYSDSCHSFAYKLRDGGTVTRFYDTTYLEYSMLDNLYPDDEGYSSWDYYFNLTDPESIVETPIYAKKYSLAGRLTVNDIESLDITARGTAFQVTKADKADMEKVFAAFQSDFLKHGGTVDDTYYTSLGIRLNTDLAFQSEHSTALSLLTGGNSLEAWRSIYGNYYRVPQKYTETIQALQEIGVIDDQQFANKKSPYRDAENGSYIDDFYDEDETVYYQSGEDVVLDLGFFTAPWDCTQRREAYMMNIYDENDELLMFESDVTFNILGNGSTFEEYNGYATSFDLKTVLTSETDEKTGCVSGTAKVTADGEEETLRYLQFGLTDHKQLFFFTDKVSDEDVAKILKSCESYESGESDVVGFGESA